MAAIAEDDSDDATNLREWLERNLEATKMQGRIRGYVINEDGTASILLQPAVPFVKMTRARRTRAVGP